MITLHHDQTSAASAVAVWRLQALADAGLEVAFAGLDVLGLDATIPATLDLLAEYDAWHEQARDLGLQMRRPRIRPPTTRAHLVEVLAVQRGRGAAWRTVSYRGYWERGADLGSIDVLVSLGTSIGLAGGLIAEWVGDGARVAAARRDMQRRRSGGLGGVPVLEFDGTYLSASLPDEELWRLAELG